VVIARSAGLVLIACALAFAAVPANAQKSRASAPYETKITCVVLNGLLVGIDVYDEDRAIAAAERAEAWYQAAVDDRKGGEEKAGRDVMARSDVYIRRIEEQSALGAFMAEVQRIKEEYKICLPYGG